MAENNIPNQSRKENIKSREIYNKKIKDDPEFYKAEKQRVAEYMKKRYNEDPEFKARKQERNRQDYLKRKERMAQNAPIAAN